MLNYAAGLAGMPTRSCVTATALGIVPGTVAYTVLGSTATHPGSVPFVVSLAAVALLTAIVTGLSQLRGRALSGRRAQRGCRRCCSSLTAAGLRHAVVVTKGAHVDAERTRMGARRALSRR